MSGLETLRKNKICGISVFDLVLGIVGLWIVIYLYQIFVGGVKPSIQYLGMSLGLAVVLVIPIGILFHAVFGVPSKINCAVKLAPHDKC